MIIFGRLSYENFLSVGANPITIDLAKEPSTLVIGKNGSAKSSMLDALTFVLFGKPFRKINKPQLVNSINQSGALVSIEFFRGSDNYKIKRGISPNIFEIILNDKKLDFDANVKDFQKRFESEHLKISYRSFCQVVILGSATYVPFMKLTSQAKREVIEDLLDVSVLARMNQKCKERKSSFSTRLLSIDAKYHELNMKLRAKEEILKGAMEKDKLVVEEKQNSLKASVDAFKILETKKEKQQELVDKISDNIKNLIERTNKELFDEEMILISMEQELKENKYRYDLYQNHKQCPTCLQKFDSGISTLSRELLDQIKDAEDDLENQKLKIDKVRKEKHKASQLSEILQKEREKLQKLSIEYDLKHKEIVLEENKINNKNTTLNDYISYEKEIADLKKAMKELILTKTTLETGIKYYDESLIYLRDDGIRSRIVSQTLPLLNERVNHYLEEMRFFASFHLDENFNETIKARHRDEFTFESFSEGEKQRISLALLFAWRDVAEKKNSLSTNLLLLDEVFDSSTDSDGIENLMEILTKLPKSINLFVISHKVDLLDDRFSRTLLFEKPGNFSSFIEKK